MQRAHQTLSCQLLSELHTVSIWRRLRRIFAGAVPWRCGCRNYAFVAVGPTSSRRRQGAEGRPGEDGSGENAPQAAPNTNRVQLRQKLVREHLAGALRPIVASLHTSAPGDFRAARVTPLTLSSIPG